MKNRVVISLLTFLIFINCTVFLCAAATLNVGPGQTYSTDGKDDQVQINQAIEDANSGDIVYLHSGTFTISAPIYITKSDITFKGAGMSSTIIQISSYEAFWGSKFSPIDYYRSYIMIDSKSNLDIYGFTLQGALYNGGLYQPEDVEGSVSDDDSENAIFIEGRCSNDKIHDIKFTRVSDNGIKCYSTRNLEIYNCVFDTANHDDLEVYDATNFKIYNCYFVLTEDCGIRFSNCQKCNVSYCTFVSGRSHENGGVYFQDTNTGMIVYKNVFRDLYGATISAIYTTPKYDAAAGTVNIRDNIFYNNIGTAAISQGYPGSPNIFCPKMTVTQSNNQYPSSSANWAAKGYGSGAITSLTSDSSTNDEETLQKPDANFWGYPISGSAPQSVSFYDKSTGTPAVWKWSFGDGTFSTQRNPVHKYSKDGIYSVTLTASNKAGSDTMTKQSYITVKTTPGKLAAAFSASPISGKAPLKVQFTDRSTGSSTAWKWSFGDKTYSKQKNPIHIYNKAGKYTVSLTVKNTSGNNYVTKSRYVVVR